MLARAMKMAGLGGLFLMGGGAGHVVAQTLELKSVQAAVLTNGERDHFVAAHNAARKAVGIERVAWSDEVADVALDSLSQQKDRIIDKAKEGWKTKEIVLPEHRMDNKYGENIAGWASSTVDARRVPGAERAVTYWLHEKAAFDKLNASGSYKFGDEVGKKETDSDGREILVVVGHYTAIVWKATTHLGAAKLTFTLSDDRGAIRNYVAVVCNYDPAGNIEGEKPF
jgi:pathogenesis-related protein 1